MSPQCGGIIANITIPDINTRHRLLVVDNVLNRH